MVDHVDWYALKFFVCLPYWRIQWQRRRWMNIGVGMYPNAYAGWRSPNIRPFSSWLALQLHCSCEKTQQFSSLKSFIQKCRNGVSSFYCQYSMSLTISVTFIFVFFSRSSFFFLMLCLLSFFPPHPPFLSTPLPSLPPPPAICQWLPRLQCLLSHQQCWCNGVELAKVNGYYLLSSWLLGRD